MRRELGTLKAGTRSSLRFGRRFSTHFVAILPYRLGSTVRACAIQVQHQPWRKHSVDGRGRNVVRRTNAARGRVGAWRVVAAGIQHPHDSRAGTSRSLRGHRGVYRVCLRVETSAGRHCVVVCLCESAYRCLRSAHSFCANHSVRQSADGCRRRRARGNVFGKDGAWRLSAKGFGRGEGQRDDLPVPSRPAAPPPLSYTTRRPLTNRTRKSTMAMTSKT